MKELVEKGEIPISEILNNPCYKAELRGVDLCDTDYLKDLFSDK